MSGPDSKDRAYHLAERQKSGRGDYLEALLAPLAIEQRAAILDLGCGSGYVNEYVAARFAPVRNLGLDYALATVELARELTKAQGPVFFCASAEQIPLPDACAGHVIGRVVLPYISVTRAVREIARVLKPGGTVLLSLHPWTHYAAWLSLKPWRWRKTAAALLLLASGAWFAVTGREVHPAIGSHRVTQSFQTASRMRKLLLASGLEVYRVIKKREFLIYARRL
jgi:SAM-dependent methyltransferase